MKLEFYENYIPKNFDPLTSPIQNFNWNDLYEQLDEPGDTLMQEEKSAEFVRQLFQWITDIDLNKPNPELNIGRRFIAVAWVMDPSLFEGSPSATKLADKLDIKRKADFWTLTGEVSKYFGITNRGQRHAWNRGKHRNSKLSNVNTCQL